MIKRDTNLRLRLSDMHAALVTDIFGVTSALADSSVAEPTIWNSLKPHSITLAVRSLFYNVFSGTLTLLNLNLNRLFGASSELASVMEFGFYQSNFVAHPLTARFIAVLKRFCFLIFVYSQ